MIIVVVRCLNEELNIPRFLHGYDWADRIIVSDGGSVDNSIQLLTNSPKVDLRIFTERETVNGQTWNPDNPHINFVINAALEYSPDWIILDDMDDVPNKNLRECARELLEHTDQPQVNAFRLYMWGDDKYFPNMNNGFADDYRSLWAWNPAKVNIYANNLARHGTILGVSTDVYPVQLPCCLLHKSWHPETINTKVDRYNKLGLPMENPLNFAGVPVPLPDWAYE